MTRLEETAVQLGCQRVRAEVQRARKERAETRTLGGKTLLNRVTVDLADEVKRWLKASEGRAGRRHAARPLLEKVPPEVAAAVAARTVLDGIAMEQSYLALAGSIGRRIEDEARFAPLKKNVPSWWRTVRSDLRHANEAHFREVLRARAEDVEDEPWEGWSTKDRWRVGIVMMELLEQATRIIEFRTEKTAGKRVRSKLVVAPGEGVLKWLEEAHRRSELLRPFYLPTEYEPEPWSAEKRGGYRNPKALRRPAIVGRRPTSGDPSDSLDPQVYAALNAVQRTAWTLNPDVLGVLDCLWEAGGGGPLPPRDDEDTPPLPDDVEDEMAMALWKKEAEGVHRRNGVARKKRLRQARMMLAVRQVRGLERFYFPCRLDFRGRLYVSALFLNPQGDDLARGLLQFAEGEPVRGEEAMRALQLHGAGVYGIRGSFGDRLRWIRDHGRQILQTAEDPWSSRWWQEAKNPWQFLAFCFAWRTARAGGSVHLPCQIDGTNNGLQLYALVQKDKALGRATGCVPQDAPADAYMGAVDSVIRKLEEAFQPTERTWAAFLRATPPSEQRKLLKTPLMILSYGATHDAVMRFCLGWYLEQIHWKGRVDEFSGRRWTAVGTLAKYVWETVCTWAQAAVEAMEWIQEVAVRAAENGPLRWRSPSGMEVVQECPRSQSKTIRTTIGPRVRALRFREEKDVEDLRDVKRATPPNLVHSLDAAALHLVVPQFSGQISTVHDAYATHPNRMAELHAAVRSAFVRVAEDDPLEAFADQVLPSWRSDATLLDRPARGALDLGAVLRSPYFFH